jgi:hypothetical protein
MSKGQKNIWMSYEMREWLRQKAFDLRISESEYIEKLLIKEKEKDERRNNNN